MMKKSTLKKGGSRLKPLSAKTAQRKREYKKVCDEIDQDMLDDIGYIRCTSCHVRHNGLLGHAHSHNLPKGQYQQYETEKENIDIRCLDCHRSLDNYVFDDIRYFKDLPEIMEYRRKVEPEAYNRFVAGLIEVGCSDYEYVNLRP